MNLFNVDWQTLVKLLVPIQIRLNRMMAWLMAFIAPVVNLYTRFTANRNANLYRLQHSSQVCRMEAVLNDQFDMLQRRIRIIDGVMIDPLYIYLRAENKKRYIYRRTETSKTYIHRSSETTVSGPEFFIQVPAAVSYDPVLMQALIEDYRLASKNNYIIQAI